MSLSSLTDGYKILVHMTTTGYSTYFCAPPRCLVREKYLGSEAQKQFNMINNDKKTNNLEGKNPVSLLIMDF